VTPVQAARRRTRRPPGDRAYPYRLDQQIVADGMAQRIVDVLETVEVNEDDRHVPMRPF
jgi:hypothetical protein